MDLFFFDILILIFIFKMKYILYEKWSIFHEK